MSTLPNECILHIVEQIEDGATLYSLLFLSRAWLPLVAARLYRDPFSTVQSATNRLRALDLLLTWIIHLTPSEDPLVLALQKDLKYAPFLTMLPRTDRERSVAAISPTLDYLSLIRVIRFSPFILYSLALLKQRHSGTERFVVDPAALRPVQEPSRHVNAYPPVNPHFLLSDFLPDMHQPTMQAAIQQAIVLAIAGHRYHEVEEIQIPLKYISSYHRPSIVNALGNLQHLTLDYGGKGGTILAPVEDISASLAFVRDYMNAHEHARQGKLVIEFFGGPLTKPWITIPVIRSVYSLLGPTYAPTCVTDHNCTCDLQQPNRVKSVHLSYHCDFKAVNTTISKLETYRSLCDLDMFVSRLNPSTGDTESDDPSRLFRWAAEEYQSDLRLSSFVRPPLPPLRVVRLTYFGVNPERVVDDLLFAFGPTLEEVKLNLKSKNGIQGSLGCQLGPWRCPRLRILRLYSDCRLIIDPNALSEFPRLEELALKDHSEAFLSSPSALYRPWCMPNLMELFLEGRSAVDFNLTSLQSMPKLKKLAIRCRPFNGLPRETDDDEGSFITRVTDSLLNSWPCSFLSIEEEKHGSTCGENSGVLGDEHSRETWHLPALQALELRGKVAYDFPLESYFLHSTLPSLQTCVIGVSLLARDLTLSQALPTHHRLRSFCLDGKWNIQADTLHILLGGFPNLEKASLIGELGGFTPKELVQIVQQLPSPPEEVWHATTLSLEDAKAYGLEEANRSRDKFSNTTHLKAAKSCLTRWTFFYFGLYVHNLRCYRQKD